MALLTHDCARKKTTSLKNKSPFRIFINPEGSEENLLIHRQANPPFRILVVDDEPDIRLLYSEVLADLGYHVEAAEDGAQAWEILQHHNYDLLITDNEMPKLSGIELLERLHASQKLLPVIMATGSMPSDKLKSLPWFRIVIKLLKPHTLMELLAAVKNALRPPSMARLAP